MTDKNVTIEAISTRRDDYKGIKFEGKWHEVIGEATKYLSNVRPGNANIRINEEGKITYVSPQNKTEHGKTPFQKKGGGDWETTEERQNNRDVIMRESTLNSAIMTARLMVMGNPDHFKTAADLTLFIELVQTRYEEKVKTGIWPDMEKVVEERVR